MAHGVCHIDDTCDGKFIQKPHFLSLKSAQLHTDNL